MFLITFVEKHSLDQELIISELKFKAIRSSGPGGQHANKVSSKVELQFDIQKSAGLTAREKSRIQLKLQKRLTKETILILQCDDSRSQHSNKALVIKRFFKILENALKIAKKRKASKPTRSSIEKRLKSKKKDALKKANRAKPDY